jgi:hypothetical protein
MNRPLHGYVEVYLNRTTLHAPCSMRYWSCRGHRTAGVDVYRTLISLLPIGSICRFRPANLGFRGVVCGELLNHHRRRARFFEAGHARKAMSTI